MEGTGCRRGMGKGLFVDPIPPIPIPYPSTRLLPPADDR